MSPLFWPVMPVGLVPPDGLPQLLVQGGGGVGPPVAKTGAEDSPITTMAAMANQARRIIQRRSPCAESTSPLVRTSLGTQPDTDT